MRTLFSTLLLAVALALGGCGTFGEAPKLETPQDYVNEARILVISVNQQIRDQNRDGIMSDAVAQSYLDQVKAIDKRADDAQALIDVGKGDLKSADLLREALRFLQREVARRAAQERK